MIQAVPSYLYNQNHEDNDCHDRIDNVTPMVFHVTVHASADKFDIPALRNFATSKFKALAEREWKTKDFAAAICHVYLHTSDHHLEMRDTILEVCISHAKTLFDGSVGDAIDDVVRSGPDFASDSCTEVACT